MDNANHSNRMEKTLENPPIIATGMAALKPKGACWYCNQPLDNVRRFCSKTCADDYRMEEEVFKGA